MTMKHSNDATMIGNFILLKAFSATLTADSESVGDARSVFRDTLIDSLIDLDPQDFPDETADRIRIDVKDYINQFLGGLTNDIERITHGLMITEEPRKRVA